MHFDWWKIKIKIKNEIVSITNQQTALVVVEYNKTRFLFCEKETDSVTETHRRQRKLMEQRKRKKMKTKNQRNTKIPQH